MLHNLQALMAPALMERLTLVVNHVLSAETIAMQRLTPHAGKRMQLVLEGWPRLLPALPALAFCVTPAGLVEWAPDDGPADLRAALDASNPAALALRGLSGQAPLLRIEGDAALAADVDWLLHNLRWDVADDLERLFGPAVAQELQRLGSGLAGSLRAAAQGLGSAAARWRSAAG